ncbi:MAG: hypothetical protein MI924_19780, partial [Chloroflexales bacterium]|nr:hypothetical protein [Chloroflexales bacterium]
KPMAMFSQLKQPTYQPRDLLRLSGVLLPVHFVLLLAFAFLVWPLMGLTLTHETPKTPPHAPNWHERAFPQDSATSTLMPALNPSWIVSESNSDAARTSVMIEAATTDGPTNTSMPALNPSRIVSEVSSAVEHNPIMRDAEAPNLQQPERAPLSATPAHADAPAALAPVAPARTDAPAASASSEPAASQLLAFADQPRHTNGDSNTERP